METENNEQVDRPVTSQNVPSVTPSSKSVFFRKVVLVILGMFVALTLIVSTVYYFTKHNQSVQSKLTAKISPTPVTWRKFVNSPQYFSFRYPSDSSVPTDISDQQVGNPILFSLHNGPGIDVSHLSYTPHGYPALNAVLSGKVGALTTTNPDELVTKYQSNPIDGVPTYFFVDTLQKVKDHASKQNYFADFLLADEKDPNANSYYEFRMDCAESKACIDTNLQTFKKIAESFRFITDTTNVADWAIYTSSNGGFVISYPIGWSANPIAVHLSLHKPGDSGPLVDFTPPGYHYEPSGILDGGIYVNIHKVLPSPSLSNWVQNYNNGYYQYAKISSTKIDSSEAKIVDLTRTSDQKGLVNDEEPLGYKERAVFIKHNDYIIVITLFAGTKSPDTYIQLFNSMLSTFHFTE